MNVIGNNLANVNTYGFKYERVTFQDLLSLTIAGASAPVEEKGGVNPKQVGLGMSIASIDKIFTQGSLQTTGKTTDLAIAGEGFFIVAKGEQLFYTRAGNFELDRDGNLVDPNGLKLQGWIAEILPGGEQRIDTAATVEDIVIPLYSKMPPRATANLRYQSNLNAIFPIVTPGMTPEEIARNSFTTTVNLYDSEGAIHPLQLMFYRTGPNVWTATATVAGVADVTLSTVAGPAAPAGATNQVTITFAENGALLSIADAAGSPPINVPDAPANVYLRFTIPGRLPMNVALNLGTIGRFDGLTQFAGPNTAKAVFNDGYTYGYLESFTIDDRGIVTGAYTNGQKQMLAQVALSIFTNPGGLVKVGDNLFTVSPNSGSPNIGEADTGGRGKIRAGMLEMSNVDLAEQFTDMIITQRGFQANSRTIITADQMIQELLGLKR